MPAAPLGGRLGRLATLLESVDSRRLRIALLLAIALHVLPVFAVLGWPVISARASDALTLIDIETTTQQARPGAGSTAADQAAAEARAAQAAAEARAAAEAQAAQAAAEVQAAAEARAAAEAQAAAEARATAEAEAAARELAARELAEITRVPGRELTPRPPTAGPVERNVSGDPSAVQEEKPGEGEGQARGDGPGTLTAKFCEIEQGTRWLAQIQECASGPEQSYEYLNVPPRAFRSGYPGFEFTGRVEFFALFIRGNFDVSRPGRHYFRLTSDDGAQLFIDDQLVVDNDGAHEPITRDGFAELSAGRHRVRISYFQGIRYELALQLFVTPPGESERVFSSRL